MLSYLIFRCLLCVFMNAQLTHPLSLFPCPLNPSLPKISAFPSLHPRPFEVPQSVAQIFDSLTKMNRCAYEQNGVATCEEMRMESVLCPKPRRLGILNPSVNDHIRPLRCHINHQAEIYDSKAGTDLLDIILTKRGYGAEKSSTQVATSPPFFCGSPPSRASNPVTQDAQFGNDKITPLSPVPTSPSSSARKAGGGYVRMKFGHKPAAVRIEGFDCLSRDRRNCSISAVA